MSAMRFGGGWRWLAAAVLAASLGAPAAAGDLGPMVTDRPVPWRQGQIRIGDTKWQVRQVAGGQPDREVLLYQAGSPPVGAQWMYIGERDADGRKRLLWVEFTYGRVTRVWIEPFDDAND
ncbi:MAG: hypothetical protein PHP86_18865 [Nevskiales bacterium]|nr:hypothetical protein [Nevskiales bacterium]